ncbi:MAG: hypothetical protein KIT65_02570 [Xanthobacteraceae bacterium]|nr:hypothetical protein [Xanthobacteraceae bacterium]
MTDYRPLLSRAVAGLDPNTGEARRAVYDRARTALVNQLRGLNPPLAEADITRERLALEDAIRKVEGEAAVAPPPARSAPRPEMPPRGEHPPRPAQPSRPAPPPRSAPPPMPPRGAPAPHPQEEAALPQEPSFEPETPPQRDPRAPRGPAGRPDPRGPAPQGRVDPLQRPRPLRGRGAADAMRNDARRATRTKLIVFGIVFGLLILAGVVGYVHRDRILSLIAGGATTTTAQNNEQAPTQPDKANDRVPQPQNQQTQAPQTTQPTAGSNRAMLFEENPGSQQFTTINGTVSWRTETVNPGPGSSPELGIRIDIDIPDRKMQVTVTIRRNPDASLPATHYIEVQFTGNDSFGGVAQVPVIRMKNNESAQGIPLAGVSARVMQGFFLIGLSAAETDRDRNLQLMKTLSWLDIPFIYNNGRRAVIAFEKGPAGEKALSEAFAAWGN